MALQVQWGSGRGGGEVEVPIGEAVGLICGSGSRFLCHTGASMLSPLPHSNVKWVWEQSQNPELSEVLKLLRDTEISALSPLSHRHPPGELL